MTSKKHEIQDASDFTLIKRILARYKGRTVLVVLASMATGIFDSIGIASLVPLLGLLVPSVTQQASGADSDRITELVESLFNYFSLEPTVMVILTIIMSALILKAIGRALTLIYISAVRADVAADQRRQLIGSLLAARWQFFVGQPVGHFANSIGIEANRGAGIYQYSASLIAISIQIAIYLTFSSFVSWKFTAGTAALAVVMFVVLHPMIRLMRNAAEQQAIHYQGLTRLLVDGISGLKPLKAMGLEVGLEPLLDKGVQEIKHNQILQSVSKNGLGSAQEPLIVGMLLIGFAFFWTKGVYSISELVVLLLLFYRIGGQVGNLQASYQVLYSAIAFFRSMNDKIDLAVNSRETVADGPPISFEKSIELSKVSFTYESKTILDGVSTTIPFGTITVVSGRSGSGKSTLIDLIAGLLRPTRGQLLVDGKELTQGSISSWRSQIGYVGQELFLLHTTLRDNILLGQEVDSETLDWAIEVAGASQLVVELPDGLETVVGERGSLLSGGQRQRVALARALLRKPKLLILDEITASLDPETERLMIEELVKLKDQLTILVISHQPAISKIADQTLYLENGKFGAGTGRGGSGNLNS